VIQESKYFWFVEEIHCVSWVLFLVVLEISLVSDIFILDLSKFLDFVVVNVELLSVEWLIMESSLSVEGIFWLLEADESIEGVSFLREELNAFNVSMLTKELLEFFSSSGGWEVLDVKVASLLWVLVSDHFFLLLNVSFVLLKGFLNIEGVVLINLLSMEILNCIDGSLDTVFLIVGIRFGFEANEGELSGLFWVLHHDQTLNVSILSKELSDIGLWPCHGEVLDIDVIECLSEFPLVLGSIFNNFIGTWL
jgi:hypothetical protein